MAIPLSSSLRIFFIILISITFSSVTLISAQNRRPKNVQVAVRAKWEGTPILLEAGELVSKESKQAYWEFIEGWLHVENDAAEFNSARDCLEKISRHGGSYLSKSIVSLFEFSLTLRSASPRLVLYRQLAEESLSSFPLSDESHLEQGTNKLDSLLVGKNRPGPGGKCCWVDTGGALFSDVADFMSWLQKPTNSGDPFQEPELFEFDHIHFDSNDSSDVAVLYGALGTECFREFHVVLAKAAKEGKVKYVHRPVLPSGCEERTMSCGAVGAGDSVSLGGYGVELALKNMEYKAMDDSTINKGVTLEDPQTEDLSQEVRDTLDVWELKDLGHQTVQRIVHASDPLQSMQEINQNFPSIVSSLSRMKLNESIKDEILANQRMVPPGKSLMALNGGLLDIEDMDLYLLIDLVSRELSLAEQFSKLKIPKSVIRQLLSYMSPPESDMFRVDFRSTHVQYLNNLEEDAMYRRWRSSLNEILMPVFPGQLRYIRKNLFHAVYVIDPATDCGLKAIDMITSLHESSFPFRFGVILYSTEFIKKIEKSGEAIPSDSENDTKIEEDISTLIIRLFMYVKENHGIQTAYQFLRNVNSQKTQSADLDEDPIEVHHVESAFVEAILPKVKSPPQDILLTAEKDKVFKEEAKESSMFVFKLGLTKLKCCLLMNGRVFDSVEEETLINAMNDELPRIQEQVYYGQIHSSTDVLDKFMSESGVSRYNPEIITKKPRYVSMCSSSTGGESVLNVVNFLHSPDTLDDVKHVTHLIAVDISTRKGIKLLREGLSYLIEGSKDDRLGVLFSGRVATDAHSRLFVKVFELTTSLYSQKKKVLDFLDKLCSFYEHEYLGSSTVAASPQLFIDKVIEMAEVYGLSSNAYKSPLTEFSDEKLNEYLNKVSLFLSRQLGLESGDNVVISNGRVTSLVDESYFLSQDLQLLASLEFNHRLKHIIEIIEGLEWEDIDPDMLTSKFLSDVFMFVSSAMATRDRGSESAKFEILNAEYSAVILGNENSSIHIDAVVDPLSPAGQKLSSLVQVLEKHVETSMRIVLNPVSSLADIPLKNYYRYVTPTVEDFSVTDFTVKGPRAFFANMPLSKTLTMNLDVPEPWLVEPVIAIHDLDNILLENLGDTKTLQAIFELEALVLTGHCFEKDQEPPRGLQLILGTKSSPHLVDTIVMANLGYWQMKVSPGLWYLQLAPGRSSELYALKADGNGRPEQALSERITINDLRGKVVHLEVVKRKGKQYEKLLVSDDANSHTQEDKERGGWNSNFLKWASGIIGGTQQSKEDVNTFVEHGKGRRNGKTINIFSIASGHLYERFLKIMILSVLKNTNRPVKFWFIKNYLSPQFKDVIPHMAQEYGFKYELITYKWPTWLHKQKEKQRIIWAYKILFLDVIFPLSLEKVIFVDADQVVRSDMGELYDMDIKGRPLAYTPFCDNNKDMDGYRFWRQGFWKEHLRGRPYHISALYVVDLVKFRETAAGDNLRVFYETLSKDPNSLSNLDQDLPNYAQHTVPIFSLPQEWLWCESWCGNATKSKAKTIDLCNNPMTKEPKLQGARRIVSEWLDLDTEARGITAKILGDDVEVQEPVVSPDTPDAPPTNVQSEEDLESKDEL